MQRVAFFVFHLALLTALGCGGAETPPPTSPEIGPGSEVDTGIATAGEEISPSRVRGAPRETRRDGAVVRVKELLVSPFVGVGTNEALKPASSFRSGINKLYVSFYLSGLEEGNTIRVHFFREEERLNEFDIECEGEKRYAIELKDKGSFRDGDYSVEVEVLDEVYAARSFHVGGNVVSPAVDRALLGTRMGNNKMPKKASTVFKSDTKAIHCGIRFLSLPDIANVEVEWVLLGEQGDESLHKSETQIEGGGSKNVGLTWNPEAELAIGNYKAVVTLGGNKMVELGFAVE